MGVRVDSSLEGIDWTAVRAELAADDFDNGRSPEALRRSFEQSQHVAITRDGVCNAYVVDVWTASWHRRGIATAMMRLLIDAVPGQHVGLQTDDARALRVDRLPAAARVPLARLRQVAGQRRKSALSFAARPARLTP